MPAHRASVSAGAGPGSLVYAAEPGSLVYAGQVGYRQHNEMIDGTPGQEGLRPRLNRWHRPKRPEFEVSQLDSFKACGEGLFQPFVGRQRRNLDTLPRKVSNRHTRHRPKTGQIDIDELDSWLAFARFVLI